MLPEPITLLPKLIDTGKRGMHVVGCMSSTTTADTNWQQEQVYIVWQYSNK